MRKEKYITEGQNKKGVFLRVNIKYSTETGRKAFTRQFNVSDYVSPKVCMASAIKCRDDFLRELETMERHIEHIPTVKELYALKNKYFPCSLKTQMNHNHFYKFAIKKYDLTPITEVTRAMVQESVNEYAETHTSLQAKHMIAVWRAIFKVASVLEINVSDKTNIITIPKDKSVKPAKKVTITYEDFCLFLEALNKYNSLSEEGKGISTTIRPLLITMYYTGLRPSECFALTKEDINLKERYITVNKAIGSTQKEKNKIIPTKTKTSVRRVPIAAELILVLSKVIKDKKDSELLFTIHGKIIDIDYLANYIRNVSKKCGIPFNMYMLRHSFSTRMFSNNINPRVIQDLMGHSSSSMSLEYARSSVEEREKAIQRTTSVPNVPKTYQKDAS